MSLWSEEYTPAPVRVIMAGGRFTEHATDEHRAKVEAVAALAPDPAPRLRISDHPALRQPPTRRVEQPAVEPGPTRTKATRAPKEKARAFTPDPSAFAVASAKRRAAIVAMHESGANDKEIAGKLAVTEQCVRKHLAGRRKISRRGANGKGVAA